MNLLIVFVNRQMNESTADSRICETSDVCNDLLQTILFANLWVHERPQVSK
jgi:hypothetical protein